VAGRIRSRSAARCGPPVVDYLVPTGCRVADS
jgi:hypothetical protein